MPALSTWAGISFASSAIVLASAAHRSGGRLDAAIEVLLASKLSVLLLVCTAYFVLFLFGKAIQYVFFGRLTELESQNVYDRLVHYVLFKLLFIGAVLDPDLLDTRDVLAWTVWFSCLGFGKIFALLCRDRYHSISRAMPDAGLLAHARVVTCLVLIMACGARCLAFCLRLPTADWSGVMLLSFECFVLLVEGAHTLLKYAADLWQALRGPWPGHASFVYHAELVTDVSVQCATLAHYAHILLLHGISILDALLLLDMRLVFGNLRARLAHYRHYRTVARHMDSVLVDAAKERLAASADDVCAICRDALASGVKELPCAHLFHGECLRGWLEHNTSCPTCRRALFPAPAAPAPPPPPPAQHAHAHAHAQAQAHAHAHAHAHHAHAQYGQAHGVAAGGPGAVQQLWALGALGGLTPSIRVSGVGAAAAPDEARHVATVLAMFPQLAPDAVRADLRRTRSLPLTIERALEGRLPLAA